MRMLLFYNFLVIWLLYLDQICGLKVFTTTNVQEKFTLGGKAILTSSPDARLDDMTVYYRFMNFYNLNPLCESNYDHEVVNSEVDYAKIEISST